MIFVENRDLGDETPVKNDLLMCKCGKVALLHEWNFKDGCEKETQGPHTTGGLLEDYCEGTCSAFIDWLDSLVKLS